MEEQVKRLVDKAWKRYKNLSASQRLLIGIAGIPGSGKTTLAALVTTGLNARFATGSPALACCTPSPLAAFVPTSGYLLTCAQLSALPDPETAHARRGASFTFDGPGFLKLVKALRAPLCPETRTVYAPSFDGDAEDPVRDDIPIKPLARVVVLEGSYLALDRGEWGEARELMDEVWFVEVGEEVARRRLVKRYIKTGIARNREEAAKMVEENDAVNGREIVACRTEVDEVVQSIEDEAWEPDQHGGLGPVKVPSGDSADGDSSWGEG